MECLRTIGIDPFDSVTLRSGRQWGRPHLSVAFGFSILVIFCKNQYLFIENYLFFMCNPHSKKCVARAACRGRSAVALVVSRDSPAPKKKRTEVLFKNKVIHQIVFYFRHLKENTLSLDYQSLSQTFFFLFLKGLALLNFQ